MKRYEENYKEEALKLSDEIGLKKASERLGVKYGTLSTWRKQRARKAQETKPSKEDERREIARLKRENEELRRANEILKDALGFFAKDRKK